MELQGWRLTKYKQPQAWQSALSRRGGTRQPAEEHSTSAGQVMKVGVLGFFCLFSSFNDLHFFF